MRRSSSSVGIRILDGIVCSIRTEILRERALPHPRFLRGESVTPEQTWSALRMTGLPLRGDAAELFVGGDTGFRWHRLFHPDGNSARTSSAPPQIPSRRVGDTRADVAGAQNDRAAPAL